MINALENFKEDYLIQYIQPLIDLDIPHICHIIEEAIYSIENDGRFQYQAYFTKDRFNEYLEAKKQAPSAENSRYLKTFPRPVIPFYELLETLSVVGDTFVQLGTIPMAGTKSTMRFLPNAWTLIQNQIPKIYQRLNQLARSHVLIHQLIQPLLNPSQELYRQTSALATDTQAQIDAFYSLNQASLSNMLPKQEGGLAVLTKLVILIPHILKELTQYVERGDTKINFDPNSSSIIKLENIYTQALQKISDPNQTTIQGFIKLLQVLPKTVSNILKEAIPLAEASAEKLSQLKKELDEQLFLIQAHLETFEENLGLKKDTFITPFIQQKSIFMKRIDQNISTFQELPNQLKPYAKLTHFISDIRLVPKLDDLADIPKHIKRTTHHIQKTFAVKNNEPVLTSKLAPEEKSILNTLQQERLKRFKTIQIHKKKRYDAWENFFTILQHAKAYPVSQDLQALENGLRMMVNGQYYAMVQTIQDLPETQKAALKAHYPYIQAFFQVESPQLDAAIIGCLEAKKSDAHVYMPNQSTNVHYFMRLYCIAAIMQYAIQWKMNWFSGALLMVFITSLYCFPLSNQLDIILKHRKHIEIAIGQIQTHETLEMKMIEARFKEEMPDFDIHSYSQTITIPKMTPDIQRPYDAAFTHLSKNRPSHQVTHFINQTLYPFLSKTLNKQKKIQLLNDDNQPIHALPFPYSPKDDGLLQSYKQLINAFYQLQLTLENLEKVDAHVYNKDHSLILQTWNVVSILMPILTTGLDTIHEVEKILQNPQLLHTKNACLQLVDDIKCIINAKYPIPQRSIPSIISGQTPFHASSSWVKSQETYQRKIHKQNMPIDTQMPQDSSTVVTPATTQKKSLTFIEHVNSLSKQIAIIDSLHQEYFENKPPLTIESLERQAGEKTKAFIKVLRVLIRDHIHGGNQQKGRESIHFIKSFQFDRSSIQNLFSGICLSNLSDTLHFIDGISHVCEMLYQYHQEEGLKIIFQIYDLLSVHLLNIADDFEHNHLKPGVFSNPLQEKIDNAFEALIEKIAPEKLFEFWTSKHVSEGRLAYQHEHIIKAQQDLKQREKKKIQELWQIQRRFNHLKSIQKHFKADSVQFLKDSEDFKFFLKNYTFLQAILFQVNPQFDKLDFLSQIKNHRPETFVTALNNILAHEKDIQTFFDAQIQHQQTAIVEYIKSGGSILHSEEGIRKPRIINHAIQWVIKKQYEQELGCYHVDYAKMIIDAFWKNRQKQENSNHFLPLLNFSDSKTFREEIYKSINHVHTQKQQKTLFSILKNEHQLIISLENEIKLSYRTKSNPPSKYQFVFEKNSRLEDENKIYLSQGYQLELIKDWPEEFEYSKIYYAPQDECFAFLAPNGELIHDKYLLTEGSNNEADIKKSILRQCQLSDDPLFYRTQKNPKKSPVPQEFINENKINLQDPPMKLIKNLNDYLREFLRYSDEKSYTNEERPCLKQKISHLHAKLSKIKNRKILEKIQNLQTDENAPEELVKLKYGLKYLNHTETKRYRKDVQYFNQIMFIDDQLEKIGATNNSYQALQNTLRDEKISAEQRFYQFSIQFKAQKRFLGAENQYIDILSKKIWRGAVIAQSLEAIQHRFPTTERKKIQVLIDILKNNTEPFVPLKLHLEHFFDKLLQDDYWDTFLEPRTLFDRILRMLGFLSPQEQFLQKLRKQNRLLDTSMTFREINACDDALKEILKDPTKPQVERLKLFKDGLTKSTLSLDLKDKLEKCLPKEPDTEIQALIQKKKEQLISDLKKFKLNVDAIELATDHQAYKKALQTLETSLKTHPPRTWSSFFTHVLGQKTAHDRIIEKVTRQVNFFKEAERLKSSNTITPKR